MASQSAFSDDRIPESHDSSSRGSDLVLEAAHDAQRILEASSRLQEGKGRTLIEIDALRSIAEAHQWMGSFAHLERTPDAGGQEHDVWFEVDRQQVWKATHYNRFGIWAGRGRPASPADYLMRIYLTQQVFGVAWNLEGCQEDPFGRLRVITTQPALKGAPATTEKISAFFESLGFVRHHLGWRDVWVNRELSVVAEDAHPDNFVLDDQGTVIPIDIPIATLPPDDQLS